MKPRVEGKAERYLDLAPWLIEGLIELIDCG
jgi:hypothetical protein